ncbi:MAG: LacI family DNA-binding transcriptional regulator, partial [Atopobiaceae bacterium]|nr:LacI family DNA-binding transcriptional regulator [Atopobiaceae bacterium]
MNINDIAKLAGVSPSTVSKVMNGRDSSISSETRSRVLEVARKYHYQPYSSVAPQASGRTFMLGALIQDMASDGKVVAGMLEASSPIGYSLLLEESCGTADGELRAMTALLSRRVDGIVWNPLPNGGPLARGELERSGVPALLLGNGPGGEFGIDFERIGYVATEALVEAGHTEVACIAGDGSSDALFVSGYRRCLFDHAIPQREDLVMMDAGDDLPSAMASRRFTAAVTSRYSFALRLCDLAKSLRYVLPQDLSLVSFFPGAPGEESLLACSVVTPPQRELGRAAAQRIIGMVEGNDSAGFPDLPYEVVSAETIAEPPSQARPRVISVGSINIDNYLSFDSLPRAGTSTSTSRSSVFPGGKCANEAVGISKLGLAAAAIGMVGDDADADVVFGALAEHGVD